MSHAAYQRLDPIEGGAPVGRDHEVDRREFLGAGARVHFDGLLGPVGGGLRTTTPWPHGGRGGGGGAELAETRTRSRRVSTSTPTSLRR